MRARYYDPTNGRFYGEDPIWDTNLFPYGDNNPISNIDPNGKFAFLIPFAIPAIEITAETALATIAASAALSLSQIIAKRNIEIKRLERRNSNNQGVQYSLRAANPGNYPDVRGGETYLNKGEVYKYGETINPYSRYSSSELSIGQGLDFVEESRGNQIEIKVKEKIKIYRYYIINKKLPAGNRIFR